MHTTTDRRLSRPSPDEVLEALAVVGEELDESRCYHWSGRYHFILDEGWSISVKPESARRLRLDACRWSVPAATLWTRATDMDRLAGSVLALAGDVGVLRGA